MEPCIIVHFTAGKISIEHKYCSRSLQVISAVLEQSSTTPSQSHQYLWAPHRHGRVRQACCSSGYVQTFSMCWCCSTCILYLEALSSFHTILIFMGKLSLMFSWEIVFPIPAQAQSLIFTLCKHFADELMVSFVNCGYFKCQRGWLSSVCFLIVWLTGC